MLICRFFAWTKATFLALLSDWASKSMKEDKSLNFSDDSFRDDLFRRMAYITEWVSEAKRNLPHCVTVAKFCRLPTSLAASVAEKLLLLLCQCLSSLIIFFLAWSVIQIIMRRALNSRPSWTLVGPQMALRNFSIERACRRSSWFGRPRMISNASMLFGIATGPRVANVAPSTTS